MTGSTIQTTEDVTRTPTATQPHAPSPRAEAPVTDDSRTAVEAELLVEDVSIDGMCGVY